MAAGILALKNNAAIAGGVTDGTLTQHSIVNINAGAVLDVSGSTIAGGYNTSPLQTVVGVGAIAGAALFGLVLWKVGAAEVWDGISKLGWWLLLMVALGGLRFHDACSSTGDVIDSFGFFDQLCSQTMPGTNAVRAAGGK